MKTSNRSGMLAWLVPELLQLRNCCDAAMAGHAKLGQKNPPKNREATHSETHFSHKS